MMKFMFECLDFFEYYFHCLESGDEWKSVVDIISSSRSNENVKSTWCTGKQFSTLDENEINK